VRGFIQKEKKKGATMVRLFPEFVLQVP